MLTRRLTAAALVAFVLAATAVTALAKSPEGFDEPMKFYRLYFDKTIYAHPRPANLDYPDFDPSVLERYWSQPSFVHNNMEDPRHIGFEFPYERAEPSGRVAAFYDDEAMYLFVHAMKSDWVNEVRSPHVRKSWNRITFYFNRNGAAGNQPHIQFDETGKRTAAADWHYSASGAHASLPGDEWIQAVSLPLSDWAPLLNGRYGQYVNVTRAESDSGALSSLNGPMIWACPDPERMLKVVKVPAGQKLPVDDFHVRRVDADLYLISEKMDLQVTVWNADHSKAPVLTHLWESGRTATKKITGEWEGNTAKFTIDPVPGMNSLNFQFGKTHFDHRVVFRFESGQSIRKHPVYQAPEPAPRWTSEAEKREYYAEQYEKMKEMQTPAGNWYPKPDAEEREKRGRYWRMGPYIRKNFNQAARWIEAYYTVEQRPEYLEMGKKGLAWVLDQRDEELGVWLEHTSDGKPLRDGWGVTYHNAPMAARSLELYKLTGETEKQYLEPCRRFLEWMDTRWHVENNNNYDAFGLYFLGPWYEFTKDPKVLDRAIHHLRFGTTIGQSLHGTWQGHNEYGWYHTIIMRGVIAVLKNMPEDHPYYPELKATFTRGVNHGWQWQNADGGFWSPLNIYPKQNYWWHLDAMMQASLFYPEAGLENDINFHYIGWGRKAGEQYDKWKEQYAPIKGAYEAKKAAEEAAKAEKAK